jgi:hypothetical protein
MVGNVSVQTFGRDSAEQLTAALRPHDPSPLVAALEEMPTGCARAVIDVASLTEEFGEKIEGVLDQIEEVMANPQPDVGMGFVELNLWFFRDEVRSLLDLAPRVKPVAITALPSRDRLDVDLQFRVGDTTAAPASEPRALSLGIRIPADSLLTLLCGVPGERGASIVRTWDTALAHLLVGENPSALAALLEHEMAIIRSFAPGREEMALALYAPAEGRFLPRRVLIDRRGEGGESAQTIVDSLSVVRRYPVRHTVQMDMPDIDFSESRLEWLGTTDVAGQDVHHFVHSGPGLEEVIDQEDSRRFLRSPLLSLADPQREVHHWLTHQGDRVILTTEPEPDLMGRILRGEGLGIREPFASVTGGVSPLPEGDIAIRLSLGNFTQWLASLVTSIDSEAAAEPVRTMSRRLLESERGIWVRIDTVGDGFDARLTLPAEDAFGILGAFVAQRREVESNSTGRDYIRSLSEEGWRITATFEQTPLDVAVRISVPDEVSLVYEIPVTDLNRIRVNAQFTDTLLDEALIALLSGSGFGHRRGPDGTVIIHRIE